MDVPWRTSRRSVGCRTIKEARWLRSLTLGAFSAFVAAMAAWALAPTPSLVPRPALFQGLLAWLALGSAVDRDMLGMQGGVFVGGEPVRVFVGSAQGQSMAAGARAAAAELKWTGGVDRGTSRLPRPRVPPSLRARPSLFRTPQGRGPRPSFRCSALAGAEGILSCSTMTSPAIPPRPCLRQ